MVNSAQILYFVLHKNGTIEKTNNYSIKKIGNDIIGKNFKDILVSFDKQFSLQESIQNFGQKYFLNILMINGLPQTYQFEFQLTQNKILAFGQIDAEELESVRQTMSSMTAELNNLTRQLHKKNAELFHLDNQKNQFLGMAAHEIRSPINAIMMYSEFLIDEVGDRLSLDHKKFLSLIILYSERICHLIEDLLDVSVIESGKFEINLYPTDLVSLIHNSIELTKPLRSKKNITIDISSEKKVCIANIDEEKIIQVISNIIINAIKFSEAYSKIDIRLTETENEYLIEIQDQGQGIPEHEKEKLFEPFESTSTKSSGNEKSTGLGLAIAKKIVLKHGGNIWVKSIVHKGSTFYVSLPKVEKI